MQAFVRLGIRLLYKVCVTVASSMPLYKIRAQGASSRMEGAKGERMKSRTVEASSFIFRPNIARRLLKSMSIKQGIKYDSPESAREIPAFIEFHNLKKDEILDPLDSFSAWALVILHLLGMLTQILHI